MGLINRLLFGSEDNLQQSAEWPLAILMLMVVSVMLVIALIMCITLRLVTYRTARSIVA